MSEQDIINFFSNQLNFAMKATDASVTFIDPFRRLEVMVTRSTFRIGYAGCLKQEYYGIDEITDISSDADNQILVSIRKTF
jgi:hypothetical protein